MIPIGNLMVHRLIYDFFVKKEMDLENSGAEPLH